MKMISVIIPVYNAEKTIKKCLNSLISQAYKNLEIILINDGSTDNSKEICEDYEKKYTNIILVSKQNEGPGKARQIGLEKATGDYISFIDSDDYIDENFYNKLVNALEKNDADIVECGYNIIDENMQLIKECKMKLEIIEGKKDCIRHYAKNDNTTNYLCNKLYKKGLFDNVSFQTLFAGEDACVLLQLYGNAEKVIVIPDNLYYYVQTTTSLCRKPYNLKRNDSVQAGIFMYDYCQEKCPENCEYYALYICSYAAQCYANLKYSNINDKVKYMCNMKNAFNKYYDKKNKKFNEVSKFRRNLIKLFKISPEFTSLIYKKVLKK